MVLGPADDLVLSSLAKGLPGISPTIGKYCAEACVVCLTRNEHKTGVELYVEGLASATFGLVWDIEVTNQMLRGWGDEATEHGACAVAFLLVPRLTDYTVIRRARTGTGIDYWLGYQHPDNILQDAARLEISGILKGNKSSVRSRMGAKKKQTEQSEGELPAYIVVVEFSKPQAQVARK